MSKSKPESRSYTDLSSNGSVYVKNHRVQLNPLPEPGVEWTSDEYNIDVQILNPLVGYGVITRVGHDGKRRTYATTEKGYDAIQKWNEKDERADGFLPCGHDGFESRKDTVKCLRSGCEQVHKKEDIR